MAGFACYDDFLKEEMPKLTAAQPEMTAANKLKVLGDKYLDYKLAAKTSARAAEAMAMCIPVNSSTTHYRKRKQEGKRQVCPVCLKDFASYSKNNYKTHLLGHLPETEHPFACTHVGCNRRFVQKGTLKKHVEKCGIVPQRKRSKKEPSKEEANLARAELERLQLDKRGPGVRKDVNNKKP